MKIKTLAVSAATAAALLTWAAPASAIPAFARKYGTSCLTCHTVYPKLNPFGEAFRRDGYRFPGVDSDFIKQETVPLGQEANKKSFPKSVWPASIPNSVPLSFGVNGQAFLSPADSTLRRSNNGAVFTLQDLVGEAHAWLGAALDDTITLWGELTFSSAGELDLEHAQVLFNDLVGPKHLFNLIVGHGFPNVTSFGPHSSYLADAMITTVPVTGILQGNPDPWTLVDNFTGLELNGTIVGRFDYAVGLNAGKVVAGFPTDNFYGRVGYKLGGMRLDGEGASGPKDAMRPWEETALTLNGFAYQSNSRFDFTSAAPGATSSIENDVSNVFGATARGQYKSLELNLGWYSDRHNHGTDVLGKVTSKVFFSELSYVVFPWLVPALRVENAYLTPEGGQTVSDLHIMPGVAFLIRPDLRVVTVFNWEHAAGFPTTGAGPQAWQGGAADWGPLLIGPPNGAVGNERVSELESIGIFMAWAI